MKNPGVCVLTAVISWLLFFHFAARANYYGDDFTVIAPVITGSLWTALLDHFRPLEILIAQWSVATGFQVWLVVSMAAYAMTAALTLALYRLVAPDSTVRWWHLLICACTPLAANTYFQIDTVSQALANLFTLAFAVGVAALWRDKTRNAWPLVALALLGILSKETSYGIFFAGSVLLILRYGRAYLAPMACVQLLVCAGIGWGLFHATMDITPGSHYGLKNPIYWGFNLAFSAAVGVLPIPTGPLITGSALANVTMTAITAIGATALITGLVLYLRRPKWPTFRFLLPWRLRECTTGQVVFLLALSSLVPALFFKASELYASQALPYIKVGLMVAPIWGGVRVARVFWPACCSLWILASTVNIAFYAAQTGYNAGGDKTIAAAERSLLEKIEHANKRQTRAYSIYSMRTTYDRPTSLTREGECIVDDYFPRVCLPSSISDGVPRLR